MTDEISSAASDIPNRHVRIIVIGGGLAGLAAAVRFRAERWEDFLILDRGDRIGGTWRDNTYPGAACDVPSHVYSYSFAPNPNWSRSFSRQAEIQQYIVDVAQRHRVLDKHVFGCEVHSARWDEDRLRWQLETSRGRFTADVLIGAFGALCEPAPPDIKGIAEFQGEIFHSARWNHRIPLADKKIAVIGTGASAIQIVPAIAESAAELHVFQRTPPWILPRLDRPYTAVERLAFRRVPAFQRLMRALIYWAHESQVVGFTNPWYATPLGLLARAKLRLDVPDPELRRRLTPSYALGCKRILLSNSYYRAFRRDTVRLVTEPITEVRANAVVTADGAEHEADIIVAATGFHVTDSPTYRIIFGQDGRSLGEVFDDIGHECYKGTAIANFPNMFLIVGPNTGLGHNSMIYMIESQVAYIADALATMKRRGLRRVEVRKDVQQAFWRMLQGKLSRSVWSVGGCASWYLDKHGANSTLWPGFTFEFRAITRRFDISAYTVSTREHEAAR
ncbi:flavin-containing monooxygenase [Nocardia sp. NPDC051570]|uniref:flavin-containing monooxygenase n=1 Tax=Nocardia sp. NPDC051570 TaxID=3364324 RepID=UPI0037A98B4A